MGQIFVGIFGLVLLFVVPPYFVASAAVDFGKNWWRYFFSIIFYPMSLFLIAYYVIPFFPESGGQTNAWGSIILAGYALPGSLFWTYCLRNVVRHKNPSPQ